jgi:O-acetyl-ADP-ribose deacetylase (regulator of RNase III)
MNVIERDLLDTHRGIIAQQVNCRGAMGSGVAQQIATRYPVVHGAYRSFFNQDPKPALGDAQFVPVADNLYVANVFGQDDFGGGSQRHTDYVALEQGLRAVAQFALDEGLRVYLPYGIGCGLGGGDWKIVSEIIDRVLPAATVCRLYR